MVRKVTPRKKWRGTLPFSSPSPKDQLERGIDGDDGRPNRRQRAGIPLRVKLQRIERRRKLRAFTLVLPLLLLLFLITFVLPIGRMMFNAVHDDTLLTLMPRIMAALSVWEGKGLPDETVYAALASDLKVYWAQSG